MKVLGFIPARSGSKGVPNKNILDLKGKPLLEYSVYTACFCKDAGLLEDVLISTDSPDYLSLVESYGHLKGYLRPERLSGDESPTIDSVHDGLRWLNKRGYSYDAVMILQPTSPFRTPEHIAQAINMLQEHPGATCVTSVSILGDHHPFRIKRLCADGCLQDFCESYIEKEPSRRQDFRPQAYIRNGAIYLTPIEQIVQRNKIRGQHVYAFIMPEANSINIDTHIDYLAARSALEYPSFSQDLSFFNQLTDG